MNRLALALLIMLLQYGSACGQQSGASAARPQEPRKPYPYTAEEVRYEDKIGKASFAGTLTKPESGGPFAAVLLLSGAGFQDRDETAYGHKPFKVLADYLTRRGIAVLRVDDRSVGGSTGDILHATPETFAADALAGLQFLETRDDIDGTKIGLAGHSEGALVAGIAASRSRKVSFVVMLAGLGLPWYENNQLAQAEGLRRLGKPEEVIAASLDLNERIFRVVKQGHDWPHTERVLHQTIADWRESLEGEAKKEIDRFTRENPNHWKWLADQCAEPPYQYYMVTDPRSFIRRIKCPVLVLCGEKDVQVIANPNLAAIEGALKEGGNKDFRIQKLKDLNHFFQHCKTGLRREYAEIEETFALEAMEVISAWIMKRVH